MRVHLRDLGALIVEVDGRSIELGTTKQAALLARLLLSPGQAVSAEALISAGWGPDAVVSQASLDSQLWRLRNVLEPSRGRSSGVLLKSGTGYRLALRPHQIDSARFVQLADQVRGDEPSLDVLSVIDEALGLWRGTPFEPIVDLPEVAPARTRLEELRGQLAERRIDALTALGRRDQALADLEPLIAATPFREQLWVRRIKLQAALGRTEEALTSYRRIRALLADELGLDPGPELVAVQAALLAGELTDPADSSAPAVRFASVGASASPTADAAPAARSPRPATQPTHLPRRPNRLLGRDHDVARVRNLAADHALVTVTGPGGCGKTRLAIEVGAELAEDYPDGVWFLDLTAAVSDGQVGDVISSTLGLGAQVAGDPVDALRRYGQGLRQLLIVDNCEHVLAGAAACIDALLSTDGDTVVLATSREPVGVDGEVLWPLTPLPVHARSSGAAGGSSAPAVELFLERSRAAQPDLADDAESRAAIGRICLAVDGLPLAIELAAARTRAFSLEEIADQVAADPSRLERMGRVGVDHHATMFETIEWSYRLLSPANRQLHRQLSVLPGAFSLETAVQVTATDGGRRDEIAHGLATLVHGSMLVSRPEPGRPTRYAQLDTVRAHARRQLERDGETQAARDRRDDFVRQLLAGRPPLGTATEPAWFDAMDDAYPVIRACLGDQLHAGGDPELVGLGAALTFYWYYRTRLVEGTHWLDSVIEEGPAAVDSVDAGLRSLRLACLYFIRRRVEAAGVLLEQGLKQLPPVPDDRAAEVAECLIALASSAWMTQQFGLQGQLIGYLRPLVAQTGDPHLAMITDILDCVVRAGEGSSERVIPTLTGLFHTADELGSPLGQWMAALELASLLLEENPDEGARWIRRLLPIQVRLGSGGGSMFLEWLANHAALRGEDARAARLYAAGQAAARRDGSGWPVYHRTAALRAQAEARLNDTELAAEREAGAGLSLAEVAAELSLED